MFRFENPLYLYALLLVPVLAAVHHYSNYMRRKRLRKYGDPRMLKELMPDVSKYRPEVKMWLLLTAFTLTIFMLARPQYGTRIDTQKRQGIEVVIAMDVSNSMMAEDVKPNRLSRAKMLFSNLIEQMRDDKVGLIVYAGEAFTQLPITSDYVSAKMFLDTMSPEMVATQGTDIGRAIDLAMKSFTDNQTTSKAIFLITDGEDHEGAAVEAARRAAEQGMHLYVLGIGSPAGAPIPVPGTTQYIKDNAGNTVVSKLNEQMCKELAAAGKGAYIYVDNSSSAQAALAGYVDKLEKKELESTVYSDYDEQFQAVAWMILFFLIVEVCILERQNRVLKRFKLFH